MITELAPGVETPPSPWLEIAQERIDAFAEVTEDRQSIHIDPELAARGPFGSTTSRSCRRCT